MKMTFLLQHTSNFTIHQKLYNRRVIEDVFFVKLTALFWANLALWLLFLH